jgi:hypothetical protein
MLQSTIKKLTNLLAPFHPHCGTKGKICVHCETEIAEVSAFAVAELLIQRAQGIEKEQPETATELLLIAKEIYKGSWYEKYDELIRLEREE